MSTLFYLVIGNHKKEVLLKPAVIIIQPVSFLDHPNLLPVKLKTNQATVKLIQVTAMGYNNFTSNSIFGI